MLEKMRITIQAITKTQLQILIIKKRIPAKDAKHKILKSVQNNVQFKQDLAFDQWGINLYKVTRYKKHNKIQRTSMEAKFSNR